MKIKRIFVNSIYLATLFFISKYNISYSYDNSLLFDAKVYNKINFENNTIMSEVNKNIAPEIKIDIKNGIKIIEYNARLNDYNKDSYNYLVFYKQNEDNTITELFRKQIFTAGKNVIGNEKILKLIENNSVIFSRVESFEIKNNIFVNKQYSPKSNLIYTPKEYNLVIKEDDSIVYNESIIDSITEVVNNKVDISILNLRKYQHNKFYNYENNRIKIDGNYVEVFNNMLSVPYFAKNIEIELSKNLKNWKNINVVYPTFFYENNYVANVKKDTNFATFLANEKLLTYNYQDANYSFLGYYIDEQNIKDYNNIISDDVEIKAIYNTKIILQTDEFVIHKYLKTGDKISSLDLKVFEKENYNIENYTIIDNVTKQENIVDSVENIVVDNSITIKPNYKEKTNKIMIRQDSYNSRFGKVSSDFVNKDIDLPVTKPLGELLEELRKNIEPNKGYSVQFRINKKEVDNNTIITEDKVLEIYFKKNKEDWITVKFVGAGIDKFLSDGQEVLAGEYINGINLPTSSGVTKKMLGWESNIPYKIIENGIVVEKSKDNLLQLTDLHNVITEKNKNLIFTAQYIKINDISLETNGYGKITVPQESVVSIETGKNIKDGLPNNKIVSISNENYRLSHFTSTLPISLIDNNGNNKIINIGDVITLSELYKINPKQNLTFKAIFLPNMDLSISNISLNNDVVNGLNFIEEVDENINFERVLGPFYFLR